MTPRPTVDIAGAMLLTGLSRTTIEKHRAGQFRKSPAFPEPVAMAARSPLFDRAAILEWNAQRVPANRPRSLRDAR